MDDKCSTGENILLRKFDFHLANALHSAKLKSLSYYDIRENVEISKWTAVILFFHHPIF